MMSSTALPVSHGSAAVPAIARPASSTDPTAPARYGRRKAMSRKKMRMQLHRRPKATRMDPSGRVWHTRAPMSDAIALRNRFAMVKGAWDEHLRGVPFPALGEGTAEQKIERLELALVDEMLHRASPETAEQAADAMWGLVHARPEDDPVKLRVTRHHEDLARLGHRRM